MEYQQLDRFEQPYSIVGGLIIITVIVAPVAYFLLKRSTSINLPPGSLGWPLIGETLEFFSKSPEDFIQRRLKKHSTEIFKTNILGEPTVVFSGPTANQFIATNELKLVRVWFPQSQQRLFAMVGPRKKHQATAPAPARPLMRLHSFLKPETKYVAKFDWLMKQEIFNHWQGRDQVRAYGLVKSFALSLSANYLLGMEPQRVAATKLSGKFDDVVNGIQSIHVDFPGTVFHRAKRAAAEVRREIELFIMEKRAAAAAEEEEEEDFLSMLMAGDESGKFMMPTTVANIVMGVMGASYGSVVTAITYMVKVVGLRPDIYHNIYSEQSEILALKGSDVLSWDHINRMKYTWAVACETMRILSPFLGTFREALTDFDFAGFTIPKGWKIFWAVSMTNKNPEYFPDPENFDPSRFMVKENLPYTFLPFGAGPRMCAGKEYARLAILTFIHNLVINFNWDILDPNEKILGGMVMPAPVKGLPIRLHPLSSSSLVKK